SSLDSHSHGLARGNTPTHARSRLGPPAGAPPGLRFVVQFLATPHRGVSLLSSCRVVVVGAASPGTRALLRRPSCNHDGRSFDLCAYLGTGRQPGLVGNTVELGGHHRRKPYEAAQSCAKSAW